jgi:hypothetical protein
MALASRARLPELVDDDGTCFAGMRSSEREVAGCATGRLITEKRGPIGGAAWSIIVCAVATRELRRRPEGRVVVIVIRVSWSEEGIIGNGGAARARTKSADVVGRRLSPD